MKTTFDQFLASARDTHGERFLYDRSSWNGMKNKLRVCCAAHGWFEQVAQTHLLSKGCTQCSHTERAQRQLSKNWHTFLEKANSKFNYRYQYDCSSWKGVKLKVSICCPDHGWFEQAAYDHLKFSGCYDCARALMLETKIEKSRVQFIKKAAETHHGKYEYDFSTWNGVKSKLKIKCPTHGWFEQIPHDHLRFSGCYQCGNELRGLNGRLTEYEIVERFRQTHGDRYDYSHLNYTTSDKKLTITCHVHGDFKQKLIDHQRGDGCPKCGKRHRWTTDEFIANSQAVHADKYTYENTQYIGANDPVTITCKIHGEFTTQPARHVQRGDGCPKCSVVAHLTQEDFLQRATERFGDRYDYSLVKFVNVATPVKIICATHGVFEQPPTYHLNNAIGCGQCSYNVSTKETRWLDTFKMSVNAKRNTRIELDGRKRSVDAFDPDTNTVYEFWGDWWHGHPDFFNPDEVHPKTKTTYGALYQQTLDKRQAILNNGYTLVEIWEHEFERGE